MQSIPDFVTMIHKEEVTQTAASLEILQINTGRVCNLSCKHCHVDAGPNRTETMSKEVMEACLDVYQKQGFNTIDITGGAPEMNPHFEWFIERARAICQHVIVRTNLVILLEEKYKHLPKFFADNGVEVVCSLPDFQANRMDKVRGEGSFDKAIQVLQNLNALGYGKEPKLILNMVYNPAGAFFPPPQTSMEKEYKEKLGAQFGIVFNHLFTITNNPLGRFKQFLESKGTYDAYMSRLYQAFNADTTEGMMCRFQLSVGYDGKLYDCDFNQAAGISILSKKTIFDLINESYEPRKIAFGNHCYGCTAGQGSSCGGATE